MSIFLDNFETKLKCLKNKHNTNLKEMRNQIKSELKNIGEIEAKDESEFKMIKSVEENRRRNEENDINDLHLSYYDEEWKNVSKSIFLSKIPF